MGLVICEKSPPASQAPSTFDDDGGCGGGGGDGDGGDGGGGDASGTLKATPIRSSENTKK
jgi:hypothetical protein